MACVRYLRNRAVAHLSRVIHSSSRRSDRNCSLGSAGWSPTQRGGRIDRSDIDGNLAMQSDYLADHGLGAVSCWFALSRPRSIRS